MKTLIWIASMISIFCSNIVVAQSQTEDTADEKGTQAQTKPLDIKEGTQETTHEVVINGEPVKYKATAGILMLKADTEQPKAYIFFIAYTKAGGTDLSRRPITFSFNGGPGCSSVWLHLGVLGPRRVLMADDGHSHPPPYQLVDNEYSLLDKTDLVFIDPVSTGYSRALKDEDAKAFHGIDKDIESVGEFIRLYVTRYERWSSPKFLIGESYGGTRAAGLAGYLQDRHGMYLNGIMLVSPALDYQTFQLDRGNDLPHILFLPTYAATAWYHNKLDKTLQADLKATLDQVEQFALGEYARVLLKGDTRSQDEHEAVVKELARFTGLSPEYLAQTNIRIKAWRFVKELLREQRRTVGRLDSRLTGLDYDAAGETADYDPSYDATVQGPFTTTFNDYVRTELQYQSDLPYEIWSWDVYPWDFGRFENRYVNLAETLREAMTKNRHLKVFVANGYYDLATPYFATEYIFNHMGLDESLRSNVSMAYYESGHMMYIHKKSLAKMKADLAQFVDSAVPQ